MKEKIKAFEQKINTIIAERSAELATLDNKIAESKARAAAAKERVADATMRSDAKLFASAKNELALAESEVELFTARREDLQNARLVTEAEYRQEADAFLEAIRIYLAGKQPEVTQCLMRILEVSSEASATLDDANRVLSRWQQEIFGNADRLLQNGHVNYADYAALRFRDYRLAQLGGFLRNIDFVRESVDTASNAL